MAHHALDRIARDAVLQEQLELERRMKDFAAGTAHAEYQCIAPSLEAEFALICLTPAQAQARLAMMPGADGSSPQAGSLIKGLKVVPSLCNTVVRQIYAPVCVLKPEMGATKN